MDLWNPIFNIVFSLYKSKFTYLENVTFHIVSLLVLGLVSLILFRELSYFYKLYEWFPISQKCRGTSTFYKCRFHSFHSSVSCILYSTWKARNSTDLGLIFISLQHENHKLILRWTRQLNLHILVFVDFLYQMTLILDKQLIFHFLQ